MTVRVSLPLPLDFLQSFRLYHAAMESSVAVVVPAEHEPNFEFLARHLGPINYSVGDGEDVPVLEDVSLSHAEPRTRLAGIERPLIFPQAVVRACLAMWVEERSMEFTFCGLMTEERWRVLNGWSSEKLGAELCLTPEAGRVRRLVDRARGRSPEARSTASTGGQLTVWDSSRGRVYPGKLWDAEYYATLARSRYVLCPNGDFVWTYRFFEAALCGALPVIQDTCPAYDGFVYATMQQDAGRIEWSQEVAEANQRRAAALLTIPTTELGAALAKAGVLA